ncbi:MAG: hypothetical protein WC052_04375 [Patescibacteria group bacterium]
MSSTGPGIDTIGPLYLGTSRATSVHIGVDDAILVNNVPNPPTVSINGRTVTAPTIGESWGSLNATVFPGPGSFVDLAQTGYHTDDYVVINSGTVAISTPGVYFVTWRVSALGSSGFQSCLKLIQGTLGGPDAAISAGELIDRTRVGTGTNTAQTFSSLILVTVSSNVQFQIVNSGNDEYDTYNIVDGTSITNAGITVQRIL